MKDKNDVKINVGDTVDVPEPNGSDIHNFEFRGTVADVLKEKGTVIVEDGDSDFFEFEPERLEVVPDYDKMREKYLKNPNVCPFCGSTNITAEHADFDDDYASRPVACEDCNKEWVEEFTLTYVIFNDEAV